MKLKSASLYKLGSLKYLQPKIEAMLVLISKINIPSTKLSLFYGLALSK